MTQGSAAFDQILGSHASIEEARRLVRKAAASPARCILLYGETGTGKGLAARAIHELSQRAREPFVDINCAAMPSELVESELFGHERGSFTGAATKKIGLVEAATGGTLFLDEIRELTPVLQAKLLTVLDNQSFRRIGSVHPIKVDVRFVAATNRILSAEVREGRFREDLYYRLQIIAINLPPLRERGEDVALLARSFIAELSARYRRPPPTLSDEALEVFRRYAWPGNVRELQHMLERIIALEEADVIWPRHIPARVARAIAERSGAGPGPGVETAGGFHAATSRFQRALIEAALARCEGHQGRAAETLGLTRHQFRHHAQRLGVQPAAKPRQES